MPIYNHFVLDDKRQPSAASLRGTGAVLRAEISVQPALAAKLEKDGVATPAPVVGKALIDTGAGATAIDVSVCATLDIAPVGVKQVGTAGGQTAQPPFPVSLHLPGTGLPRFDISPAIGCDLSGQGILALIGRDVLSRAMGRLGVLWLYISNFAAEILRHRPRDLTHEDIRN